MYNTSDSKNILINESLKIGVLIGVVILLAASVLSSNFFFISVKLEGVELGRIIYSLFIVSEIPIILNYFYLLITKFRLLSNLTLEKFSSLFAMYYAPSLIFHSGLYTIVIGLVLTHILIVKQYSTYCMIFILILGLIWLSEIALWMINWPLYPKSLEKTILLYWLNWLLSFGMLIGLPFHTKTWNLLWISLLPLLTFIPLFLIIGTDLNAIRNRRQPIGNRVQTTS